MSITHQPKKRKQDDIRVADKTADDDTEPRKKRKRAPHSKKREHKDVDPNSKPHEKLVNGVDSSGQVDDTVDSGEISNEKPISDTLNTLSPSSESKKKKPKKPKIKSKEKAQTTPKSPAQINTSEISKDDTDGPNTTESKKEAKEDKYPNPGRDGSLSESASKALLYVYERLTSRSEWKFNKARQNWIIRNIWDEKTIPELYFASCLKYLKGVQGNSRNVLIKECNSILEKAIVKDPVDNGKAVRFQEPPKVAENDIKSLRAQMIIKKLEKNKNKE